jgi:cell division topological specificity factor
MIEWVKRLFGAQSSGAMAKERLRLVLMSDHIALSPEMIEQMKLDFVEVISRYVEVDRDKVEVSFEREDRALAMLANIPILSVSRPASPQETTPEEQVVIVATAEAPGPSDTPEDAVETPEVKAPTPPPRRRRRKRAPQQRPAPMSP